MSNTMHPVRAHPFTLQDTAHSTDLPASKERELHLLTAIFLYIWHDAIVRVPLSTLQRQTEDGGLDLIDVAVKCYALFLVRFWAQGERDGSLTAEWLNV